MVEKSKFAHFLLWAQFGGQACPPFVFGVWWGAFLGFGAEKAFLDNSSH
jgi:hypothetical protein